MTSAVVDRPSITCGHCKGSHDSVAAVRACSGRPDRPRTDAPTDVPSGRYAVKVDGDLNFYKVNKPTEGRWAGYVFVDQVVGDNYYGIKVRANREKILAAIAVNPGERSRRYGREIGECGVCGRQLTDAASRAAGIGPVCAKKF